MGHTTSGGRWEQPSSELAPVLSGTHLQTLEEWKAQWAKQREEKGSSVGMNSTKNRIRVACMVAQLFTPYATT